jgi:hypothetical protein
VSQSSVPPGTVKFASLGNRRATIRYRCAPATIGKVVSAEDHEFQFAWVVDLSLKGLGMQVSRSLKPGRFLMISIKTSDGRKSFDLSARVKYCNQIPHGEYSVGCELVTPLTPDDLDQLL